MAEWVTSLYPGGSVQKMQGDSFGFKVEPRIMVLHSTETAGYPNYAYNKAPHVTAHPGNHTWRQHVPLNKGAWALQAGSVSTNSWGAIQIEIIGYAANLRNINQVDLDWLGGLIRMLMQQTGIPIQSSVRFDGPAASGVNGSVRLTPTQWYAYKGVLGHQHVPTNSHWDPGPLDINQWMNAIRGTTPPAPKPPEEFDMKLISADYRGIALVGAGYYESLSPGQVASWVKVVGNPVVVSTEDFDNMRASSTSGTGPDVEANVNEDAIAQAVVAAMPEITAEVDVVKLTAAIITAIKNLTYTAS